uniref:TPX2 C-terminal domain-containing protein n=1 Tax=Ciona savignyi TaxID=51511 RepID=H2ZMY8_CIOSA
MTNHRRALTSEERQLDEVKSAKEKAKQTKRTSELSLQKIRSKSSPSWNVVSKPRLTTPREFHFQTSERAAKLHPMATRADCSTSIDFTKDLRKHEPSPNKLKTTVVKPFHFSDDKKTVKRKLEKDMVETKPFVPMAKAIHDFHKNTPKRFRAKTSTTGKAGPVKAMKVTIPKTPQFSAIRTRPILTMSEKEKEELDVQEIKNNQFKANEVRRSVTNPAPLKKVEKKPLTVPVGFNLTKHNPAKQPDQKEKPKPFKARPLPLAILEKTTGIKEKQVIKATVPQSPAFALKHRVKPAPVQPVKEEPKPTFYHPAPKSSAPPTVKSTPVITKPEPFSFDKNDTERFAKKKEKINEIINQESKPVAFVAQAMPVMEPGQLRLPEKKTKDPTKPLPFNLSTDTKAARKAEKFSRNVEDEIKHLRDRTLFKANVNIDNVLHKPWKPKKVEREALVTEKFNLHSDERAKERQIFEEKLAQEREEKKRLIEEETKRKEIAEKEEIARLRRSMEHKATEVKHYTRVKVTHSEKKLTEPCSPQFSTRFKK